MLPFLKCTSPAGTHCLLATTAIVFMREKKQKDGTPFVVISDTLGNKYFRMNSTLEWTHKSLTISCKGEPV